MKPAAWFLPICSVLIATAGCGRSEPTVQPRSESLAQSNEPPRAVAEEKSPGAKPKPVRDAAAPKVHAAKGDSDEIFSKPIVLRIEIEIPRAGMSVLRRTNWGGGGGENRPTAKATIREGGVIYSNVAVHLKGAAGSFRPVDDNPALTLNFDKFVPDQSFHGLHKISLNNSAQDQSYVSEKICRELFDAAGVPVPRAGYAIVKLNGREMGLYVMLEGANKQFLKRYFKNASGNLYDGGFVRDLDEGLSVNSGDHPEDRSDLRALRTALAATVQAKSLAPVAEKLDVDRFLSMMALEVMVLHWDGYGMNKNNWRVFHDVDSDKMVFIPHGMDQTFGISQRCGNEVPMQHWAGSVARVVLGTAEGRRRYVERFHQIYTNVFNADRMVSRIDEIESALVPVLAQYDRGGARNQEQQAAWFKQQILRRDADIRRQISVPVVTMKFGSDGAVKVTGWRQAPAKNGLMTLGQTKDAQGKAVLSISSSGNGMASSFWRAKVVLGPGQYRFEGKARLKDVTIQPNDARAGVGLRISGAPMQPHLSGTRDWSDLAYDFEVEDEGTAVELICELTRALKGETVFDVNSLRLVRVR